MSAEITFLLTISCRDFSSHSGRDSLTRPCKFPVNFSNPRRNAGSPASDAGFKRYPQNSLLIPCSEGKFADFGQNWAIFRPSQKNPLYFPLFSRIRLRDLGRILAFRARWEGLLFLSGLLLCRLFLRLLLHQSAHQGFRRYHWVFHQLSNLGVHVPLAVDQEPLCNLANAAARTSSRYQS